MNRAPGLRCSNVFTDLTNAFLWQHEQYAVALGLHMCRTVVLAQRHPGARS